MAGAPADGRPLPLQAAVCCETGRRRRGNEDNFYLNGASKTLEEMNQTVLWNMEGQLGGLYAVSDGLGGMDKGELASTLAVTALGAVAPRLLARPTDSNLAVACLCEISRQVRAQALRLGCGMGATLVAALLHPGGLELYNLGDSRGYLMTEGILHQLSRDHTTSQSFRDMGLPPPPPGHNGLTQYLGMDEEEYGAEPYHIHVDMGPNSRLLLCSDGLTSMVDDSEIGAVLQDAPTAARAARALADAALEKGGKDNITVLVADYMWR